MLDGHSQAEAPLPGDQYEQTLERTRASIFRDFRGITCVFFGFHGLAFAILISGGLFLDTDVFMETALGGAIVAWLVSVFLAVLQFVVALWNALTVRWWVTVLGVLPWMIIATEAFVPLMFALL